jgi:membrane protein YqaA with SNARE-associated domain
VTLRSALRPLGGLGLVVMGVLDNSLIPTPGGQDVLVMVLAAAHPDEWLYYGAMGTLGAVVGAAVGYWLGRTGGQKLLERTVSQRVRARVERTFQRWGAPGIFVAALMPPPLPIGPFLLGAGAVAYPPGPFLLSLGAARAIRYLVGAWLAATYGRAAVALVRAHAPAAALVIGGVALAGALVAVIVRRRGTTATSRP